MIIWETDKYHEFLVRTEPYKHKQAFTPVTREEMEAFIGILILMGIVRLPKTDVPWFSNLTLVKKTAVNAQV